MLLDLDMPGNAGFARLLLLLASIPGIPVAILAAYEAPATIRKAITLGAAGYIPKTSQSHDHGRGHTEDARWPRVASAAYFECGQPESTADIEIARRLAELSPQQVRILARLVEGKLNKQIVHELGITEQTVKGRVSTILGKLNVLTRTEAAILSERCGKPDSAAAVCHSRDVS